VRKLITVLFFSIYSIHSLAAAFDCTKASSNVEKLVCLDKDISRLDDELSNLYKEKFNLINEHGKIAFKKDQIHWLSTVRNVCNTAECLKRAYEFRLIFLTIYNQDYRVTTVGVDNEKYTVQEIYNANERNLSFNKSVARKIGGQITQCSNLIDLPAGRNQSYGGYCDYEKNGVIQQVRVCDDDMVGHFHLEPANSHETTYYLAEFVVKNCMGG
jgi:uncharacterized protein